MCSKQAAVRDNKAHRQQTTRASTARHTGRAQRDTPTGRPSGRHTRRHAPVLVVGELDEVPLDALAAVLLLLHLEDELVELLLQLLVGVVDQELLEVVVLERLEPELDKTYIYHAQRTAVRGYFR